MYTQYLLTFADDDNGTIPSPSWGWACNNDEDLKSHLGLDLYDNDPISKLNRAGLNDDLKSKLKLAFADLHGPP